LLVKRCPLEVIEIERIVATYLTRYRHDPLLEST
jgi:hypothetical protein